jgi:hypothetical protein
MVSGFRSMFVAAIRVSQTLYNFPGIDSIRSAAPAPVRGMLILFVILSAAKDLSSIQVQAQIDS